MYRALRLRLLLLPTNVTRATEGSTAFVPVIMVVQKEAVKCKKPEIINKYFLVDAGRVIFSIHETFQLLICAALCSYLFDGLQRMPDCNRTITAIFGHIASTCGLCLEHYVIVPYVERY